jgi:hypothetical protein
MKPIFLSVVVLGTGLVLMLSPVEAKTFMSKDGFSFDYPSNWKLKDRENRFTSVSATLENKLVNSNSSIIVFENLNKTLGVFDSTETANEGDSTTIDSLNEIIRTKWNTKEFESATDKYIINNKTAPYVIGTFERCDIYNNCYDYAVMAISIKLDNANVIGQYIAQWNDFDLFLNQVEKIFQSVREVR